MIRTIRSAVARFQQLAASDPSPDARAAYRVVLRTLAGVDDCTVEDLIAATASEPVALTPAEESEIGRCSCDLDHNPEQAFDSDFPAEVA